MATQLRLISFNFIALVFAFLALVVVRAQLFYDDGTAGYGNGGPLQLDSEMPTMVKYMNVPTRRQPKLRQSRFRQLSAAMPRPLIYGGEAAIDGEVRHMVSFRDEVTINNPRGRHFCGGTILYDRWIVTAASCLFGKRESEVFIIVGTNKLETGGGMYTLERFFIHSDFRPTFPGVDDIALAKTVRAIDFDRNVNRIFWRWSQPDIRGVVTVAGFGKTNLDTDEGLANVLTVGELVIRPCIGADIDDRTQICAGSPEGTVDTCPGDIGGAMLMLDKNSVEVMIGIVTQGSCDPSIYPTVFIRLDGYHDWLALFL